MDENNDFVDLSEDWGLEREEIDSLTEHLKINFKNTLRSQVDFRAEMLNGIVKKLNSDFARYLKRNIETEEFGKGGKIKFVNISTGLNIYCYILVVFPDEEDAFDSFVSAIRRNEFKSDDRPDNIFLNRMWGTFVEDYEQYRDPQRRIRIQIKVPKGNKEYEKIAKWLRKYFEASDWEVNLKCVKEYIYEEWS